MTQTDRIEKALRIAKNNNSQKATKFLEWCLIKGKIRMDSFDGMNSCSIYCFAQDRMED